ncbi:alpha/beta hydrolase [Microbacterium sp.]|uniref:alpha/beta fold hydrolase n=1 Tax=Microbacterium sp. TaxID=51671 RepID=UPI00260A4D0D|nr:alpha/beta hydrolase [Microbacterium sp.]
MTEKTFIEPEGRVVPYITEGEGPVALVLITDRELEADGLGVISHYLVEEAGFHVIRVGARAGENVSRSERVEDALAVLDHLGLDDAWIGGHGYGGTLARIFASEHTDRVNGLLLLGVEDEQIALAPAIPVLIVQASEDDVTPAANAESLRATAPERASIKRVEGAGHLFPATHAIETAVIIEEYLDWD